MSDYFPRPFHFHPKNWSIRSKILFLGFITTIFSLGAIFIALGVVLSQYTQVRSELTQDYQNRVDRAVNLTSDLRRIFAEDYANWDEMHAAVETNDSSWFSSATTGSLNTFQTDEFWIYRFDGTLLHSESSQELSRLIPFDPNNLSSLSRTQTTDFFLRDSDRIIHFTSAPIVDPTDRSLPSNGFIIVAKVWDQERIDSIAKVVGSKATLSYDQRTSDSFANEIHILEPLLNRDKVQIATVEFIFVDRSLELVRNSLLIMIVVTTILGGFLIYYSFKQQYHWFVHPIRRLIDKLREELGSFPIESALLASKDELVILQQVVSDHIDKLHQISKLSLTVESSTNGIALTDLDGKIQYVNSAWVTLNGYSKEEAIGKNPRILKSGKTPEEKYKKMWDALRSGESFTSESFVNRRKDGSEYDCRLSVYPIEERGKTVGYVGIQQNISHRKEVDRMKTEFISVASHQLRTPLSAMRWFGELLLENKAGELTPKQKELVQNQYDSTLRLIALVNALLNISRLESGRMIVEPEPTNLSPLLDSIIAELSARIELKKITLHLDLENDLPIISIDPQLVRQVYSNLITNAVKYTPEGGTITIAIKQAGEDIKSTVSDTGVGIPTADQPRIFSKFFRATNVTAFETDGTGLGLYLAQKIVLSSQGTIGFESTEGKGTTFWFTLPKCGMQKKTGSVRIGA